MCEAAAQLGSYYAVTQRVIDPETRCWSSAGWKTCGSAASSGPATGWSWRPRRTRLKQRQSIFSIQGFVGSSMVFQGDVIGVPLSDQAEAGG